MNETEIMKALECCAKNPPSCADCNYKGKCNRRDCYDYLKLDALDLIKRKNAEIERATKDRYLYTSDGKIELLPRTDLDKIRAEAIKEFAENAALYLAQFYIDKIREFIRTKTKLDPVYDFNPSERELNSFFNEIKDYLEKIAKEMGVETDV